MKNRLEEIRKQRGIKQEELAEALEVSRQTIGSLENGRYNPSILLAFELFGGAGLELIALGCGICYMLSGHHGLYSSQTFVTNKLRAEYMSHKWRVRVKKGEE